MTKPIYTQEQLDAIIFDSFTDFAKISNRIEEKLCALERKIDHHFRWSIGLILGLYLIGLTDAVALAHVYGWF